MIEVVLGSRMGLNCLKPAERDRIKADLTFPNPAYEQALKYSKYERVYVPRNLYYYEEVAGRLLVPIGYDIPFPYTIVKDCRLERNVDYPKPLITLRGLQEDALRSFKETGTVVLPTGAGKTIFALYLAGKLKQRVLVVVQKDDLIAGWTKDAKMCYGEDLDVGLVKGKVFNIGQHITLTTIQTLSKLGDEKIEKLQEEISMVICDETHKCGAKSYKVLTSFPAKYKLGLTATLMRNDGLVNVVTLLCGKEVYNGTNEKTDAIIAPEKIHIIRKDIDSIVWKPRPNYYYVDSLQDVGDIYNGDEIILKYTLNWNFYVGQLEAEGRIKPYPLRLTEINERIATDEEYNKELCRDIRKEYRLDKSMIVFCRTIQQIDILYEMLKDECPKIQKFYGNMKDTKEEAIRKAESKEVLITLATIAIATEGTNIKPLEVGFLASSVANEKDLVQILGRLRRTCEGKSSIKIYDYRFPYCVAINKHGKKRDAWYKNLGIVS